MSFSTHSSGNTDLALTRHHEYPSSPFRGQGYPERAPSRGHRPERRQGCLLVPHAHRLAAPLVPIIAGVSQWRQCRLRCRAEVSAPGIIEKARGTRCATPGRRASPAVVCVPSGVTRARRARETISCWRRCGRTIESSPWAAAIGADLPSPEESL